MYSWQRTDLPLGDLEKLLESRRQELLHVLPMEGELQLEELEESLVSEWVLLLEKRDEVIKQKLAEDNSKLLLIHLHGLQNHLNQIREFDLSETPQPLRDSLFTLQKHVAEFLNREEFEINESKSELFSEETSSVDDDTFFSFSEGSCTTSYQRQPSQTSLGELDGEDDVQDTDRSPSRSPVFNENTRSGRILSASLMRNSPEQKENDLNATKYHTPMRHTRPSKSSTPLSRHATPGSKVPVSADLRKGLLKSRQTLKSTPDVKRSPGGTPKRKKRCLDMNDPGDLLTHALQKKFRNVRRLYGSPSVDSPGSKESSFNISID